MGITLFLDLIGWILLILGWTFSYLNSEDSTKNYGDIAMSLFIGAFIAFVVAIFSLII